MRRRRRRALLPFWGPSARAAAPGAGGRAGGSRRGARRVSPRGSGRRQQVGQPGWPGSISSARGRPRVWPPRARAPRPRPSLASDTSGCLLRWELRRCVSPEELGTALRVRGAPGSRAPRERQPRGWALRGGRESCSGRGDPQFCGASSEKVSEKILGGASSEREALKCHQFPGKWKGGFSNYRGAKLGRKEGRKRGAGVAWGVLAVD